MPNPTLQEIMPLLSAPCGDVLKAHLLSHLYPSIPRLNPLWFQGYRESPRTEAEVAAAATREAIKDLPTADKLAAVTRRAAGEDKLAEVLAAHKPQTVVAERGATYALGTPVVVPITEPAKRQPSPAPIVALHAEAEALGVSTKYRTESIRAQIAEAKAAGVPVAREEAEPDGRAKFLSSFIIDGKEWVTVKEAAKRLGLQPQAVYIQCVNSNVSSKPAPEGAHQLSKVYPWDRVQAVLASKLKVVDK